MKKICKKMLVLALTMILTMSVITPADAKTTYIKASVKETLLGTLNDSGYSTKGVKLTVKVTYHKKDISYVKYLAGDQTTSKVKKSGKKLSFDKKTNKASVTVKKNQTYTFLIVDKKGHSLRKTYSVETYSNPDYADEYKAVWFPYYSYELFTEKYKNTEANFRTFFKGVLKNCKKNNFNCIIVHARAFGDAFYDSDYFPTSSYIAGTQGKSLSYDPLEVMTEEAHKKGIRIEAWINPYRVSFSDDYSKLSADNPARIWHESSSTKRNVLAYKGRLYYNPAKEEVRELIINGVKEIVNNYDVDAIHMDDYFYPSFSSSNYKEVFDYKEYNASSEKEDGMSIVNYRRKQVNLLVKGIYSAVKEINPDVEFGISPAGNIDNLTSKYSYYVDIEEWCSSDDYVDYICPQIYWGFTHTTAPYDSVLKRWISITDQSKVKLYVGLAAYKVGTTSSSYPDKKEWNTTTVLRKEIQYGRKKKADGFAVFEYEDLLRSKAKKAVKQMKLELQ